MQEHIQWPLKSTQIICSASKDTACGLNKLWKGHPANKEGFLMTAKLLSYCQGEGAEQRPRVLWDLCVAWHVVLGMAIHSTAPALGMARGSFTAPHKPRLLRESRGAASPTLLTWQFGHYRPQMGALAPQAFSTLQTQRKTVPVLKGLSLFCNHSFYIISFVYTCICYIKQNYTEVMDIVEEHCHNICILPH